MPLLLLAALLAAQTPPAGAGGGDAPAGPVQRITTRVPFPRGLVMLEDRLYVLARGRVRDAGGVSAAVNDLAGTIFVVDPDVTEPVVAGRREVGRAVRENGEVFAAPTDPPLRLWDPAADPPEADTRTDRPYCTLRFHEPTQSFYLCAFSGIDQGRATAGAGRMPFSKNFTDAILRYDLRTKRWHEVERHDMSAAGRYPHHDPARHDPPHGFPKGPDNCLALGDWLYVAAKDNSLLLRYDLREIAGDPGAPAPEGRIVFGETIDVQGLGPQTCRGQSGLAYADGWLYVAYRTTSQIVRIRLDESYRPVRPIRAQLLALFDPWEAPDWSSSNITDIDLDDAGRLYVCCAKPARVYRFAPDPADVLDARNGADGAPRPWINLADAVGNPRLKSENVLYHDGWLYVTSGDAYDYQAGADGAVFRVRVDD